MSCSWKPSRSELDGWTASSPFSLSKARADRECDAGLSDEFQNHSGVRRQPEVVAGRGKHHSGGVGPVVDLHRFELFKIAAHQNLDLTGDDIAQLTGDETTGEVRG